MDTETKDGHTKQALSPQEVARGLDRGDITLIDVRTPQEFAVERIGGALLAPMATLDPRHLPAGGDRRLVLHCSSGKRSETVADMLLDGGHDRVAHLDGGLEAWKKAGLAYVGTDPTTGNVREMKD